MRIFLQDKIRMRLVSATMLFALIGCSESYDMEVRGELSYMPMLGADALLVEYEPAKFAVIYADDDTKLVNLERTSSGIVWKLGSDVIVRGDKTISVEDFAGDEGVVKMTSSVKGEQMIDLWINAGYINSVDAE